MSSLHQYLAEESDGGSYSRQLTFRHRGTTHYPEFTWLSTYICIVEDAYQMPTRKKGFDLTSCYVEVGAVIGHILFEPSTEGRH